MTDDTIIFDKRELEERIVHDTLKEVAYDLKQRGYNPVNQIIGYLTSGDLGYISSYRNCRNKIKNLDKNMILEVLLTNYLK